MKAIKTILASALLTTNIVMATAVAEEVTLKHNDIELWADLTLAEDKSLADGVVMLLHGTLAHNRMEIVTTVSELLNDEGYNTLAVNLSFAIDKRPEGMLDCTIEHRHRHSDAIDELQAWMTWLKDKGAGKVAVWGHSRGGNQVACFAIEHNSELLENVILVAPGSLNLEYQLKNYQERHKVSLQELIDKSKTLIDTGKGDELMEVPAFVYCENAKASASAFYDYLEDTECRNTPGLLKKIQKPTLVVLGSEDDVVAGLEKQMADLGNDQVSVYTIDGAGHFFRDLNADEMVEQIDEFLGW